MIHQNVKLVDSMIDTSVESINDQSAGLPAWAPVVPEHHASVPSETRELPPELGVETREDLMRLLQDRGELVSRMLEGEIGQSLRQAEVPTPQQQRVLDKSARPRNRLKVSEFERQRQEAGDEASSDHDALVCTIYERKLQMCANKHFWSWVPDSRLRDFWHSLNESQQAAICDIESPDAKALFWDRVHHHKGGKMCFSCLDPVETCIQRRFLDDRESLHIYTEFFRIAVTENVPLAVTRQVVDVVHKVILSILEKIEVPCGARVRPGTFDYINEVHTEHIRLLVMAEMLYLFEERLIKMYCRDGPGRAEQAAADALMAELIAEEEAEACCTKRRSKEKKGKPKVIPIEPSVKDLKKKNSRNKKKGKGGRCPDEEDWEVQARKWAADRRANKTQDDDGMGSQGKDLLKLLCQNLRRRMTAQIEGKMEEQSEDGGGVPITFKLRSKKENNDGVTTAEEDPAAQAAADDFERMLSEMKEEDERLRQGGK